MPRDNDEPLRAPGGWAARRMPGRDCRRLPLAARDECVRVERVQRRRPVNARPTLAGLR